MRFIVQRITSYIYIKSDGYINTRRRYAVDGFATQSVHSIDCSNCHGGRQGGRHHLNKGMGKDADQERCKIIKED